MKIKRILPIITIVLALNACMVGPDFQKVEVDSLDSYRFAKEAADTNLNLKWWELFDDKVLVELIDSSLTNNNDIRIAVSSIEESRIYLGYTKADLYPNFSYGANGAYGNENSFAIGNGNSAVGSFSATANLNWEIDFWGKYRRSTEAARAELLTSEYALNIVQLSIINAVSNSYYILLDFKRRLLIAERTFESRKESTRIIKERFDKGTVPEIDLNQAQIQEAIAASVIPAYERSIAFAENAISVLCGELPHAISVEALIGDQKIPEIPSGLPSQLLTRRPDIKAAEQQVVAQNAQIGVAQAMRFPSISLTAAGGAAGFNATTNLIGSAGASLFGPIFNFGKNKRRVEMERERTKQTKYNYEQTVLMAFRETEDALVNVSTLSREFSTVELQLAAAANAAKLSRARYDGGVTSYLEVLDSERQLFQVELYHSELMKRRLTAHTNLYKALGGGWINKE